MKMLLFFIASSVCSFLLGYWIAGHPTDARAFWARVVDAVRGLRKPKT